MGYALAIAYLAGAVWFFHDFGKQMQDSPNYHPAAQTLVTLGWPLIALYAITMGTRDWLRRRS